MHQSNLGTIIEGESLLNDRAAIVLFNVFLVEMQPGDSQTSEKFNSIVLIGLHALKQPIPVLSFIFILSLINLHF